MTNASTRSPRHLPERLIVCEKPWNKGYQYQQSLAGGSGRSLGTATNEDAHLIWWYRLGRQSAYLQHYGFQLRRLDSELRQHFCPHGKRLSQEPPRQSCLHIHINYQHVTPKMLLLTGISLKSWIIHNDIMTLFISSHLTSLPSGCSKVCAYAAEGKHVIYLMSVDTFVRYSGEGGVGRSVLFQSVQISCALTWSIRPKNAEIPNFQKFLNFGGAAVCLMFCMLCPWAWFR